MKYNKTLMDCYFLKITGKDTIYINVAKLTFLTPDTPTYVCVSGGKKC